MLLRASLLHVNHLHRPHVNHIHKHLMTPPFCHLILTMLLYSTMPVTCPCVTCYYLPDLVMIISVPRSWNFCHSSLVSRRQWTPTNLPWMAVPPPPPPAAHEETWGGTARAADSTNLAVRENQGSYVYFCVSLGSFSYDLLQWLLYDNHMSK